jgi:hypothetical protein
VATSVIVHVQTVGNTSTMLRLVNSARPACTSFQSLADVSCADPAAPARQPQSRDVGCASDGTGHLFAAVHQSESGTLWPCRYPCDQVRC